MRKLAYKELRADWRMWLGYFIVLIFSSLLITTCCIMMFTAWFAQSEELKGPLFSLASFFTIANGFAAWAALNVVMKQVVSLQQRSHALWIQAGASPDQVSKIVYAQSFISMAISFVIGAALAIPFSYMTIKGVNKGSLPDDERLNSLIDQLHIEAGPISLITAFLIMALLTFLGTRVAAKRAKNTQVMELVHAGSGSTNKKSKVSLGFALIALIATAYLAITQFKPYSIPLYSGMLYVGTIVLFMPWIIPPILKLVVNIPLGSKNPAVFIAKKSARYHFNSSSAAITLLFLASAFTGVFLQGSATGKYIGLALGLPERAFTVNILPILLVFAGPVFLMALTAGISVFIAGRTRGKELATVQSAGGSSRQIITASVVETLIYAITAAIISLIALLLFALYNFAMEIANVNNGQFFYAWWQALIPILFGFIVMGIAAIVPTVINTKKPIVQVINS